MSEPEPGRYLALKAVMMPRDTNPYGSIFGGVLLSYMDQAGAVGARHAVSSSGWPVQPLVTVGMDKVAFHQPVWVGDVVNFWTSVKRVGRTSLTIHVDVEADRDGRIAHLTEADIAYVAISSTGADRQPVPIRGVG